MRTGIAGRGERLIEIYRDGAAGVPLLQWMGYGGGGGVSADEALVAVGADGTDKATASAPSGRAGGTSHRRGPVGGAPASHGSWTAWR